MFSRVCEAYVTFMNFLEDFIKFLYSRICNLAKKKSIKVKHFCLLQIKKQVIFSHGEIDWKMKQYRYPQFLRFFIARMY